MKQSPSCIGLPEEWLAIRGDETPAIVADPEWIRGVVRDRRACPSVESQQTREEYRYRQHRRRLDFCLLAVSNPDSL